MIIKLVCFSITSHRSSSIRVETADVTHKVDVAAAVQTREEARVVVDPVVVPAVPVALAAPAAAPLEALPDEAASSSRRSHPLPATPILSQPPLSSSRLQACNYYATPTNDHRLTSICPLKPPFPNASLFCNTTECVLTTTTVHTRSSLSHLLFYPPSPFL